MSRQFSLFQSLCVISITSSAYGGQLPTSITSRYFYCYELRQFSIDGQMSVLENSFVIDNLCMDWQGLTYHFLSSTEGGTTSVITAPKAGMTVVHLNSITMRIKLDWFSRPSVLLICQFEEPSHALHVYNDIYKYIPLTREKFTIYGIQKLLLDPTGSRIIYGLKLTQQAGLYTEFYIDMQMILTFKEENSNGDVKDPVLIFLANNCSTSDVLVNKNVVIRFNGNSALYIILTFDDKSEASSFCKFVRAHVDENVVAPIPSVIQEALVDSVATRK